MRFSNNVTRRRAVVPEHKFVKINNPYPDVAFLVLITRDAHLSCYSIYTVVGEGGPIVPRIVSTRRQTASSGSETLDSPPQTQQPYEDPLINYNPQLLDNPMVPQLTNRRVFTFSGYMVSRFYSLARCSHSSQPAANIIEINLKVKGIIILKESI